MTPVAPQFALHQQMIDNYCDRKNIRRHQLVYFTHGANNVLYRFLYNRRNVVVKFGINPAYRRLHVEFDILSKLRRISPDAIDILQDPATGTEALIISFVKGSHSYSLDDSRISEIGAVIASYHYPVKQFSRLGTVNHRSFIDKMILPVNETFQNSAYINTFRGLLARCGELGDNLENSMPATPVVLVHGDLIPQNIILTEKESFVIIDWEGARHDSPEADLVTLIKAFRLDEHQTDVLLDGYGHPVNPSVLQYRKILHYLQVIAWRCAIQIYDIDDDQYLAKTIMELEEELAATEKMLSELQG